MIIPLTTLQSPAPSEVIAPPYHYHLSTLLNSQCTLARTSRSWFCKHELCTVERVKMWTHFHHRKSSMWPHLKILLTICLACLSRLFHSLPHASLLFMRRLLSSGFWMHKKIQILLHVGGLKSLSHWYQHLQTSSTHLKYQCC